ncbi:hypothetical protein N0V88_000633 [Collariella sp. IMI 366227]|nr:hypothetical protein N0V88_000633 [Collariella sp. IMI 366227]
MVVRALQRLGVRGVRVNERHDIVMDVDSSASSDDERGLGTYKVSGSAYKLTRTRSLHHGTYREALAEEEVVKGVRELTSPDWIFGQTPQFTFSTYATEEDPRERPEVAYSLPYDFRAHFTVRHGEIQSANISGLEYHDFVDEVSQDAVLSQALAKQRLHYIKDWRRTLKQASPVPVDVDDVGEFLNHMFGIQTAAEKGGALFEMATDMVSHTLLGEFLDGNIIDL